MIRIDCAPNEKKMKYRKPVQKKHTLSEDLWGSSMGDDIVKRLCETEEHTISLKALNT